MDRPLRPLILIAEDSVETRRSLAEFFQERGFRIAVAENGAEALLAVQRHVPDVVLTDIDMPLLDGIALTARLRKQPATAAVPIVVLTGTALSRITQRARAAGCDAVLLKPCSPQLLLETVERVVPSSNTIRVQRTA